MAKTRVTASLPGASADLSLSTDPLTDAVGDAAETAEAAKDAVTDAAGQASDAAAAAPKPSVQVRVVCKLPNASALINGVKFAAAKTADGTFMVSEPVAAAIGAKFAAIPGFEVAPE